MTYTMTFECGDQIPTTHNEISKIILLLDNKNYQYEYDIKITSFKIVIEDKK